jgi:hypothetical protein
MTQEHPASASEVTIRIGREVAGKMPPDVLASLRQAATALEDHVSGPTASMVCAKVEIRECEVFMSCTGFQGA